MTIRFLISCYLMLHVVGAQALTVNHTAVNHTVGLAAPMMIAILAANDTNLTVSDVAPLANPVVSSVAARNASNNLNRPKRPAREPKQWPNAKRRTRLNQPFKQRRDRGRDQGPNRGRNQVRNQRAY